MSKVITFSRVFPSYHPRKGEPTRFIEKIYAGLADGRPDFKIPNDANALWDWYEYYNCVAPKHHTIRAGHRFKVGDKFSPRVWSGKPYRSKQIIIAPDIEVKKVWGLEIKDSEIRIRGSERTACRLYDVPANEIPFIAVNDGLSFIDFMHWFQFPKNFEGQIICWNENIIY